jgi:FdhE protein
MPRAETITRNQARQRELNDLEAQRPELAPWLRPLRVALASLDDDTWVNLAPVVSQHRSSDTPLLDGALVSIDAVPLRSHVRAVLAAALGPEDLAAAQNIDELAVFHQTITNAEFDSGSPALNTAVLLAAVPMFIACARSVAAPADWTHGYCHVCGALPVFAEVLGLERTRQLRCGRCCTAWKANVLVCPFCGEKDHAHLGSLVPEGPQGQICWVETCNTCQGYVKTRAALRSMAPDSVLVEDARTIDLDLIAAERGFGKPSGVGRPAQLRITVRGVN